MKCPKNTFIATFLYLDRIHKEGKLNLKNDSDVEDIMAQVEKEFDRYISNVRQFESNLVDLPHKEVPQIHILSKHIVSGANYIKEKGIKSFRDKEKLFEVNTKHNIAPVVESIIINDGEQEQLLRNRMIDNIYLDNEEIAYLGVSRASAIESKMEGVLQNIFEEFNLGDIFSKEDMNVFLKITQQISLTDVINPIIESGGFKLKELGLKLNEENIDSIVTALKNSSLKTTIELTGLDTLQLIVALKETLNDRYKRDMYNLIELRTSSFPDFKGLLFSNHATEDNTDFVNTIENAKNLDFTMTFKLLTNDFGFLFKKRTREDEFIVYTHVISEKRILNDKLNEKVNVACVPKDVVVDISNGVSIELEYNKEEVDLLKTSSTRTDRPYFYHSNLADGRIAIEVIDESDTAPNGGGAIVMREVAKNAKNIIAGTGTAITGTARSIVSQLANSGTIEDVEGLEKKFTELCGVFEIKSAFFRLLYKAMNLDKGYGFEFKKTLSELSDIRKNSGDSKNISQKIEEFTKGILGNIRMNETLSPLLDGINYFDAIRGSGILLNGIISDKDFFSNNYQYEGKKIFENYVFSLRSDIVKEVAGVQAGMLASLIMSQKDTCISITTREGLTGKTENMKFLDVDTHYETKEKIFKKELSQEDLERNNLSPKMINEYFNKKSELEFTTQIYSLLRSNFDLFVDAFRAVDKVGKSNLKILSQHSGLDGNDFIYYTSKTGKSTKDDIKSLYFEYLNNNGSLPEKILQKLSDESKTAFDTSLDIFDKHILKKIILNVKDPDIKESDNYVSSFFAPISLYSMFGENKSIASLISTKNAFPINKDTEKPYIFSIPVNFMKKNWEEFLSKPIEYRNSMVNTEIKDILDNFTSSGKEKLISDAIFMKSKPVIVSSRILTSIINLYDTVAIASKREHRNEKFAILAVSTSTINKAIANINKEFLNTANIEIISVDSPSVAVEVNKACSKRIQYAIVSNYVPIARGLSLSDSDDIIMTDGVDRKSDGIQLSARGMNPSKNVLDSDIHMMNGGENFDVTINFSEKLEDVKTYLADVSSKLEFTENGELLITDTNKDLDAYGVELLRNPSVLKAKPTTSSLINETLHNSIAVYKGFTSGTMSDTKTTQISKLFEPSKQYENILNSNKDNENENDYTKEMSFV